MPHQDESHLQRVGELARAAVLLYDVDCGEAVAGVAYIVPGSAGYIRLVRLLAIDTLTWFVGVMIYQLFATNQTPGLMIFRTLFFHVR